MMSDPSTPAARVDARDLRAIHEAARVWAGDHERLHPPAIDEIVIADDALPALVEAVARRAGGGRVLLVCDRQPMWRGGEALKPLVADLLRARGAAAVEPVALPMPGAEPAPGGDSSGEAAGTVLHATLWEATALGRRLSEAGCLVAVGSGSVTDVAKYARHLHARDTGRAVPLVSFATAASVTAYTSALAVLTVDGVKRTLPARPPEAVICDLRTLVDAPPALTRAGFGDVLARSVSYGDWFLAAQLGMDDGFSHVPGRLLERAEQDMLDRAAGVATGEAAAVRAVTEALLLAGLAMSLVNQTAPLSGWEHVISHFLDLSASEGGRGAALHGAQVGVGTLVAARAYERAWPELDFGRVLAPMDARAVAGEVERLFGPLARTPGLLAEVERDLARKVERWNACASARRAFVGRLRGGGLDGFPGRHVRSPGAIEAALLQAGAPRAFGGLDPPVERVDAVRALRAAHLIRARFTLGDLLAHCGWLTDESAAGLVDG